MQIRQLLKIAVLFASALPGLAQADSAIAESLSGGAYACWNKASVEEARECALAQCKSQAGQGCGIVDNSLRDSGGYAAVAQSASRMTWAIGFNSQDDANRYALNRCVTKATPGESCQIVLTYLDRHRFVPTSGGNVLYVQVR
jgi:hypothetical protein